MWKVWKWRAKACCTSSLTLLKSVHPPPTETDGSNRSSIFRMTEAWTTRHPAMTIPLDSYHSFRTIRTECFLFRTSVLQKYTKRKPTGVDHRRVVTPTRLSYLMYCTRIGCLRPHVAISRVFYGSISTGTDTPKRYARGHQNRGRTREGEPEASPSQARPGRGVVCTVLTLYQQIQGQ